MKKGFFFLYRPSKNTEQSEYMWWPHMAFFLEIRWRLSKTIRTLFRKSWCPIPCHNLQTRLFYLNICMSLTSVVIFHFLTNVCSFKIDILFKEGCNWGHGLSAAIKLGTRSPSSYSLVSNRSAASKAKSLFGTWSKNGYTKKGCIWSKNQFGTIKKY